MTALRNRDGHGIVRRLKAILALTLLLFVRRFAGWFPRLQPDRFLRLVGAIDGFGWAPPVKIRSRQFGKSMTIPAIERILVDGKAGTTSPHELAPVATNVFGGFEPFQFNVSFACGRSKWLTPGPYGNPHSPWFNVFLGYYELDVDASVWGRPFGYRANASGVLEVDLDDLARLIHADWNYFSNYMYGVPLAAITAIPRSPVTGSWQVRPRTLVGDKGWDHVIAEGTEVCSAFLAGDGASLDDNNWILNDIWRASFGEPYGGAGRERADDPTTSFFPTAMSGELLLCFDHQPSANTYRTFIFGGSVNDWWAAQGDLPGEREAHNAAFLGLQLETVRKVIASKFSNVGFNVAPNFVGEVPPISHG
jgi:hypothetical protein